MQDSVGGVAGQRERAVSVARDSDGRASAGAGARAGGADAANHGGPAVTLCFAGATFLGAFLLFLVQPLIARYILPWFGGGAAVWTTCMLFFQTALLGGYLYAHLGVSRLGTRVQAAVHGGLLLLAVAAALPSVAPAERWRQAAGEGGHPTGQILLLLLATVGLPCVALAATSPLLHAWYGRIRPGAAVYRLYALSNLGSLLALLAYPLVVEPLFTRRAQAAVWTAGLAAFAALCGGAALLAARYATRGRTPDEGGPDAAADAATALAAPYAGHAVKPGVALVLWLALPACASALLLATTNTMTQDLAPVPFLWVLPLALYLITFIIAFDHPRWYSRPVFVTLLVIGCAGALWVLARHGLAPAKVGITVFAVVMFAACMMLHGELARLRPPTARLTAYYLAIAAGGVVGGLLVAVGAPMLLRSHSEFQLALCASCVLAFVAPLLAERRAPGALAGFLVPVGVVILGGSLWAMSAGYLAGGAVLERDRDFYGVLSVVERQTPSGQIRRLHHGAITHGQQFTDPARRGEATAYFRADSGIGLLLGPDSPLPRPRRVGVVGLGIGTIAAYAQPGDVYHFYEISPNVERVARRWFTYLGDAEQRGAKVEVVIGDGRLALERRREPQRYDAIALDAFSGDAVPVHLLTAEAFDLYARHLAPGGVVIVQVSNRYVDLRQPVIAVGKRLGWHSVVVDVPPTAGEGFASEYVLLSADPARIEQVARRRTSPTNPELPVIAPWTDEHANMLRALHRQARQHAPRPPVSRGRRPG
jgi:SAM-dependent methyltransferase